MQKIIVLFLAISTFIMTSCSSNEDETAKNTNITINFNHTWDETIVTNEDFNDTKFENANGDKLSIEKLRYLISNIYVENSSGTVTELEDYLLINLGDEENLTYTTENLLLDGTYNLYFTFGFSDDDNLDGVYTDLNTASFGVPAMLGGGYHYMQFDGKYIDESDLESGFNYHAIGAYNDDTQEREDTSFEVDLGEIEIENNTVTIDIEMDISEWFVDPHTWDLNVLNQMLMPNYNAQIMMSANGKTAFSLVEEEEED